MFPCQNPQTCEFDGCSEPAVAYGGFRGANAWAGYVCLNHAETSRGFVVWELVGPPEVKQPPNKH